MIGCASMKLLMFDFDGVIVASAEPCFAIHQQLEGDQLTREVWRTYFYGNAFDSEQVNIHYSDDPVVSEEKPFFKLYKPIIETMDPVPGLKELVHNLAQTHTLTIVSSGFSDIIQTFLERHGLRSYFQEVWGADIHKKKTVKIQRLLDQYQVTPDEARFITDTLGDVKEAQEVGTASIGVTWGVHTRDILALGAPLCIVDTIDELTKILL
ncbi:hypothetical protein COV06_00125 [Candidatus Uhrbacteria bacterium CG10_big_fil_rev_8_21_14_0_10_50_16]|uniref:HAD family hydrolase n=1 Tax=Candidatus Uhrbacteria bacterium CG10_big_fil_rev_8_21_14_0_10_50_16 TaxID=1975039 RepID=A0A2H0RMR9_9BACT|nr:MAG: hypothetical protein COV06_00125 [Candidatus Uhrbacteria bacterium CG10_big_fil_rev_8_21_14_0_10_50_16]